MEDPLEEEGLNEVEVDLLKEQVVRKHNEENLNKPKKDRKPFEWTEKNIEKFKKMKEARLAGIQKRKELNQLADEIYAEPKVEPTIPPRQRPKLTLKKQAAEIPLPPEVEEQDKTYLTPVKEVANLKPKKKKSVILPPESESEDEPPRPVKRNKRDLRDEDLDFLQQLKKAHEKEELRRQILQEIEEDQYQQRQQEEFRQRSEAPVKKTSSLIFA